MFEVGAVISRAAPARCQWVMLKWNGKGANIDTGTVQYTQDLEGAEWKQSLTYTKKCHEIVSWVLIWDVDPAFTYTWTFILDLLLR